MNEAIEEHPPETPRWLDRALKALGYFLFFAAVAAMSLMWRVSGTEEQQAANLDRMRAQHPAPVERQEAEPELTEVDGEAIIPQTDRVYPMAYGTSSMSNIIYHKDGLYIFNGERLIRLNAMETEE